MKSYKPGVHKPKFNMVGILIFSLLFSTCLKVNNEHFTIDSKSDTSVQLQTEVMRSKELELFDDMPNIFKYDGGDMYTYDSVRLEDRRYIFISNLSGLAVVKMNGQFIYLKSDSSQFTAMKPDSYQEVWFNEDIRIVLKISKIKDFEENEGEGSYLKGVLEIRNKNLLRKIKIHGYSEV